MRDIERVGNSFWKRKREKTEGEKNINYESDTEYCKGTEREKKKRDTCFAFFRNKSKRKEIIPTIL